MIKIVITEILNFCSLIFRFDYPQNDLNCIIIRTTIVKYHRIKLHIPHLNFKKSRYQDETFRNFRQTTADTYSFSVYIESII